MNIKEYLSKIGTKGGHSKSEAKRKAVLENVKLAQAARAEKRAKAKDTATTTDLAIKDI